MLGSTSADKLWSSDVSRDYEFFFCCSYASGFVVLSPALSPLMLPTCEPQSLDQKVRTTQMSGLGALFLVPV